MQTELKSGFTLVETIVVGLLMSILAAGFISVLSHSYRVEKNVVGESIMQSRLYGVENTIILQIRNSSFVLDLQNGEEPDKIKNYTYMAKTKRIALFNDTGAYLGGFAIGSSGELLELSKTSMYGPATAVSVGGIPITLASSSSFVVYPNRKISGINLIYTSTEKGVAMSKVFSVDSVRCRN